MTEDNQTLSRSTVPELPAMPPCAFWWTPKEESGIAQRLACWSTNSGPDAQWDVTPYYTADQMRAYAESLRLAAWRVGMEQAARIADGVEAQHWNDFKGRYIGGHPRPEQQGSSHCEGMSDGAGEVATAIRAAVTSNDQQEKR